MRNISRRTFLSTGGWVLAGVSLPRHKLFATRAGRDLAGIQLYTVRDAMAADPLGTLKQLSAIGYRYVEHAGYGDRKFYGYKAAQFRSVLRDIGLSMPGGHVDMGMKDWDTSSSDFTDEWKYTVEDAVLAGQQYLITPSLDRHIQTDYERLMRLLDLFNRCGAFCLKQGLKFGYHNDFEINNKLRGKKLYQIILEQCDPSFVIQELDIGNLEGEGLSGLEILKTYPERFELMHVKDEIKAVKGEMNNGYDSTVLGEGIIPIKPILDLARNQGTKYFFVEQESYQGRSSVACAKADFKQMKNWGY